MSVPSDTELALRIRTLLEEGTLPSRAEHQKIYAGYGEQQFCDCCGRSIDGADVLYEIELPGTHPTPLAMHLKCFDTWVAESKSRSALAAAAATACGRFDAEYASVTGRAAGCGPLL